MKYLFVVVFFLAGFLLGYHFGIGNQTPKYGKTGLPKNCKALIMDNLTGVALQKYTPEDALDSINRNCGANGLIWAER